MVRGAGVTMTINAIDCDVHPTVTGNDILLPYLETYWRDSVEERGMGSLESAAYPPNAPITARPDFRGPSGYAATDAAHLLLSIISLCWFPLIHARTVAPAVGVGLEDVEDLERRKRQVISLVLHGLRGQPTLTPTFTEPSSHD